MSAYGGYAYGYDYGGSCCERKVDAITLLTVIGAIAGLSLFLRQAVIDNMIQAGRKKKKRSLEFVFTGNIRFNVIIISSLIQSASEGTYPSSISLSNSHHQCCFVYLRQLSVFYSRLIILTTYTTTKLSYFSTVVSLD